MQLGPICECTNRSTKEITHDSSKRLSNTLVCHVAMVEATFAAIFAGRRVTFVSSESSCDNDSLMAIPEILTVNVTKLGIQSAEANSQQIP